jgi:hypothetical protein
VPPPPEVSAPPVPSLTASFGPSLPESNANVGFGSLQAPAPAQSATKAANPNVTSLVVLTALDGIDMTRTLAEPVERCLLKKTQFFFTNIAPDRPLRSEVRPSKP